MRNLIFIAALAFAAVSCSKKVDDAQIARSPFLFADSGIHVSITPGGKLSMQFLHTMHVYSHVHAGASIPMMLAEKEPYSVANDSHEERGIVVKSMLEFDRKS